MHRTLSLLPDEPFTLEKKVELSVVAVGKVVCVCVFNGNDDCWRIWTSLKTGPQKAVPFPLLMCYTDIRLIM